MNNREKRIYTKSLHLYLALQRKSQGAKRHNCIRHVIKINDEEDLAIFENKLLAINGEWRIHKTVNARNVEKARIWLIKHLIDHPENASFVDTAWRTALLQKECKETKYFMLDVDTEDEEKIRKLEHILSDWEEVWKNDPRKIEMFDENKRLIIERIKTPKGWHYITNSFDTREICKLEHVDLLRDGYKYVKTVGDQNVK